MVFFTHLESAATHSEQDTAFATQLREAVIRRGKPTGYSLVSWSKEFAILGREISEDRIQKVLTWYCTRIGQAYVPLAYSAKTFRQKFLQIESCMAIDLVKNPEVVISLEAEKLFHELKRLPWGNGIVDRLPAAIQLTFDEHAKAIKALQSSLTSLDSNVQQVALRIKGWLGDSASFVRRWFSDKSKRLSSWQQWNGDLLAQAFRMDSDAFTAVVLQHSRSWENRTKTGVLILNKMGIKDGKQNGSD